MVLVFSLIKPIVPAMRALALALTKDNLITNNNILQGYLFVNRLNGGVRGAGDH